MNLEEGGAWIFSAIEEALASGKGLAIGKLGTSEFNALYCDYKRMICSHITQHAMFRNAGLWPTTPQTLVEWTEYMMQEVLPNMDAVAEWNPGSRLSEQEFLNRYAPQSKRVVLRSLEPYYQTKESSVWSLACKDPLRIAVVSPFSVSISKQSDKAIQNQLFPTPLWRANHRILPIRTGCSPLLDKTGPAAWSSEIFRNGWKFAVDQVVQQVVDANARVALVGCGALSLPIVHELKKRGIIAIHLGGATQILFGIRGKRWDTHSVISTFYTEDWISPDSSETPRNAELIEGGCYW
jgi:hypothetical protein